MAALAAFALGIGVNTAMYSVCDAILFHPVELANLDRLVIFEAFSRGGHEGIYNIAPADFYEFQKGLEKTAELGFAEPWNATITRDGEPEQVEAARVTSNWIPMMGMTLVAGRIFLPGEDAPGKDKVAILGEGLAGRRFGGASALGRSIRINGENYLVVGIVKQSSRFPTMAQVLVPHAAPLEFQGRRADFRLMVAALPKPGATLERLRSESDAIQSRIVAANPKTHVGRSVLAVALRERVTGGNDLSSNYVQLLLNATAFVLLLACANVANLQLARVTGRTREFAVLAALGASRWRIASQVLIESGILSLGGAVLGCLLAIWSVGLIKNMLPSDLWIYAPMWQQVGVNWFALGVTVLLSVTAGLVTGLVPAWNSSRADAQETLREGGRAMSSGARRQWFRAAMVAFQMTAALVLLIGAGLMVRGTQALFDRYTANDPARLATLQLVLPATKYPEPAQRGEFVRRLEAELERLPARREYGLVNFMPLSENLPMSPVVVEGRPEPPVAERPRVAVLVASPGYFGALRVPLRQGRVFSATDGPETDPVCVVDEKFASTIFGGENPLGRRVSLAANDDRNWCRVIGVTAANFHNPWDREPRRTLYRAMAQVRPRVVSVAVRTEAPMEAMLPAIQRAVLAVDDEQPVRQLKSQMGLLDMNMAGLRMVATMMAGIGVIALVLSAVGVFSVVSYMVSERTSEIGMRVAMGASPLNIFSLVSRQTLWMCGAGLALGLVAGYALAQVFSGLIWGVSANDFWSLASVSLILILVGALAMYVPARRAMRLDPMEALRHD
jgi:putative ABC transport system permease protein